jgi:hypothetical protein
MKTRRRSSRTSPEYLIKWAILLTVLFVVAQASGWREFTSILSGTNGSVMSGWRETAFFGIIYIITYLGVVVLAPILILAALILKIGRGIGVIKDTDESRTNIETD